MGKTTLQTIIEQKTNQIRCAIEEAIDAGAKIRKVTTATTYLKACYIDDVYIQIETSGEKKTNVILCFKSDKIAKVLDPSKDDLEKLAEQKRAELEEIEKQIKERAKE